MTLLTFSWEWHVSCCSTASWSQEGGSPIGNMTDASPVESTSSASETVPTSVPSSTLWDRPRQFASKTFIAPSPVGCSNVSIRNLHPWVWSGVGNTSGHLLRKSWKTMTYLFPQAITGSSITSSPRIWNTHCTGMGWRGGRYTRSFPEVTTHWGQFLEKLRASRYILSHHKWRDKELYSLLPEKWLAITTLLFSCMIFSSVLGQQLASGCHASQPQSTKLHQS